MRVANGEVGLSVEDGAGDGTPVLLLHGWPDSSRVWRHQRDALAASGFRVITADLRGFGESDKPQDIGDYNLLHHLNDVLAILDELGIARTHLVGHDWGAMVSWIVAAFAPQRVDHFVSMCLGHPDAMRDAGRAQLERFWYALLFQFPDEAEEWLTADGWRNTRDWLAHPDHAEITASLARPGALRASMHIYRANLNPTVLLGGAPEVPHVTAPTLVLRGAHDFTSEESWTAGSERYVDGLFEHISVDAGHWIQLERPDEVTKHLLGFLPLREAQRRASA